MCECEREIVSVYVCEKEREIVSVYLCVRERPPQKESKEGRRVVSDVGCVCTLWE